ncbi:MAG: NifB/NifX family molybdenum-iron cluster-binding protein [Candidatus Thermoplasmatota archaeon]|nr:NifB/NifX family molybdenum-iron cluster-binding protein [Candidatus Thermoplasmatota archaeon]
MKVGIPSMRGTGLDDEIGEHFGRVPFYTIVETDSGSVKVIKNTSEHMGGQGLPAELLRKEGVHTMICRGLGRRAIAMFEESNIDVFVGASGTVRDALESLKRGDLPKASEDDACQQHAFREHHHHSDHDHECKNH